ncbi:TPA: ATP synthase F0 subunit B [Candidatus Falkowbacteria bacterium]|nr:MAG: ATP synthase subunit b [Candidatus Falkowbacteria bacterium GW2011_GWF2_43_32]HBA36611.1 ATP synthase F0 subunit B [Candidatus Falkowbacteria bacterium]
MTLIRALGIDGRILLAQFFNFAVLAFVLWRFAYRPLFNMLEERRRKVAQGVEDAEAATKKLVAATDESRGLVTGAKKEAALIVEEAKKQAEIRYKEIINKSREDIGVIINEEREKMRIEKAETLRAIKNEIAGLVVLSVEKVLGEKIDAVKDQELIERTVKKLK